ncbi:MAG: septal ring lytic transglycosylase RlpA family protein [Fibrobacter sp.]|nr:septal ring lytic transglycosylase RlpA family protein [Fibrobacter sp.]
MQKETLQKEGAAPRKWTCITLLVCFLASAFVFPGCAGSASIASRPGYDRGYSSSKHPTSKKKAPIGTKISGSASYYGKGFDGKKTASGEIFNQNAYTCAHKSLPFGTKLRVTRKSNGKSVVVRVNDRGPYAGKRILDLSTAAGKELGLDKAGHAEVEAEVIE